MRLLLIAAFLLVGIAMSAPRTAMTATIPQQGQVEGEVLQVFPTMIVIKNEQGHATILQLNPRTQVGGTFKPGDKIVAFVTPYGVSSVQPKPTTAQIP